MKKDKICIKIPHICHNCSCLLYIYRDKDGIANFMERNYTYQKGYYFCNDCKIKPPSKDRAKLRSKTYPGIAKAMADQWGGVGKANKND